MILDYIDNLALSDDEAKQDEYACIALTRLGVGLFWLYEDIARIEKYTKSRAIQNDVRIALGGKVLQNAPLGRISCAFHWYAVSVFNYAQLAGWLRYRDKQQTQAYVQKAIPRIAQYRNKVAAHFAITNRYSNDNDASVIAGLITNIAYAEGRFYVGSFSPKIINGKEVGESNIPSWSLTFAHEQLIKRFWPTGRPKDHHAIKLGTGDSMKSHIDFFAGP